MKLYKRKLNRTDWVYNTNQDLWMMFCSSESQISNRQKRTNLLKSYQCIKSNYSLAFLIMNLRSQKISIPHDEDRKESMCQKQK